MTESESYVQAVVDSGHLKTKLVTFDNGYDVMAAARKVKATHVCVPVEYGTLGAALREEGFNVVVIIWDYHDDTHFSCQYDKALTLVDELGGARIAIAQPRVHTKRSVHGYLRYRGIRRVVEEGSWGKNLKHFLFGGFNPAEPVIYRELFSNFINSTIEGYISGIMLRSIMYGQVFADGFGLYDRVIDEMGEYRVSAAATVGDYPVSDNQFALWSRNMDQFRNFFAGLGGSELVEYIRGEEQYEGEALQELCESFSDADFGEYPNPVSGDGPL